ncbi:serine/threonine protein kinase [Calothrix sp. NIES-4071]|nr:serine/threonine protein kinase [Calothrix sp. NIES-4071]BAZ56829.1 serine/threonine protein kinase [Calothrix sp. NIES-4105]
MSTIPFANQGYRVIHELGCNFNGGRVTYLAQRINTDEKVVIKEFQFARSLLQSWSGFKAYEREIEVLQGLNHPGIPRYLDSFETPSGFCMVQEYKHAQSLSVPRSFAFNEIKQIAVSILSILVYLQNRIPPIFHRDIKPENILIDESINVYLVDFGFARIGNNDVAMSSVASGTLGFMAPEQIYNHQLTKSTDLYSLGVTLVCLLTGTKSTAIHTLINEDGCITFKDLEPQLSLGFLEWLSTMVEQKPKNRYKDASTALFTLQPLDIVPLCIAKIDKNKLEFTARQIGEKLTQTITILNDNPKTTLIAWCEVAPNINDAPHTPHKHDWIDFSIKHFYGDKIICKVHIDTSYLIADKTYHRQLLLHTNSAVEIQTIEIKIKTAPLPIAIEKQPYASVLLLLVTSVTMTGTGTGAAVAAVIAAVLMTVIGAGVVVVDDIVFGSAVAALVASFLGAILGPVFGAVISVMVAIEIWCVIKAGVSNANNVNQMTLTTNLNKGFNQATGFVIVLLTTLLASSAALVLKTGVMNFWGVLTIALTSSGLYGILIYLPIRRRRLVAKYLKSEKRLIKP